MASQTPFQKSEYPFFFSALLFRPAKPKTFAPFPPGASRNMGLMQFREPQSRFFV
jgi:hypothetical protein